MIKFDQQRVVAAVGEAIKKFPELKRVLVAYSGGVDSHVLLHASQRAVGETCSGIRAVHINHQLQPRSELWKLHCAETCDRLKIPFVGVDVKVEAAAGQSPQEAARDARYSAIKNQLEPGDVVLTAHHQNDQAETVLLQLLRGGGVGGLAAMPASQSLGVGTQLRPFIDLPQSVLSEYAAMHALQWVEDPSNRSDRYARNYLRNRLWPTIESHWPAAAATLARAAVNCAEASILNATLADIDSDCTIDKANGCVDLPALSKLEAVRRNNLLRHWLKELTGRFPARRTIQSIVDTVINSRVDAQARVVFESLEIRRYRGFLHAVRPAPRLPPDWAIEWRDTRRALEISELGLTLPVSILSGIENDKLSDSRIEVRLRGGGESIVLPGRPRKTLKALLQENAIPPWRRDYVPLIYVDGDLVAVYGISNS